MSSESRFLLGGTRTRRARHSRSAPLGGPWRGVAPILLAILSSLPIHPARLLGQDSPRARLQEAREAWDAGHFVDALEELESILSVPDGGGLTREIALLTGEIHPVTEITTDGRAVRWSPDGRYAAYESGGASEVVTHILEVGEGGVREVATVPGFGLVFSPSRAQVAFLTLLESQALTEARDRLREEYGGRDRTSWMRLRAEMARLEDRHTRIQIMDLLSSETEEPETTGVAVQEALFGPGGDLLFVGRDRGREEVAQLFRVALGGTLVPVAESREEMTSPVFAAGGSMVVFWESQSRFAVAELGTRGVRTYEGIGPVLSGDGNTLAYADGGQGGSSIYRLDLASPGSEPRKVGDVPFPVSGSRTRACPACTGQAGMALSADGSRLAIQGMPREDWEIFLLTPAQGAEEWEIRQVTREIQHDLYPVFLPDGRLLAVKGEGRHRRSHLYDLETGEVTWLFRNNTVRTVAPEYEWALSPDGTELLLVAERDGNTVSPERGVYLMDLTREVSREEVLDRVRANLASERDLRARGEAMYAPLEPEVRAILDEMSLTRIFRDEEALFRMGSKYIREPGNRQAIEYLVGELRAAGYEPELQWFEAQGVESANVVVRLPGTVSPEVVYAVSAHFDSNDRSPGADDNTSATVGLLEMARALADHPLPATVEIAFFTGEEAGLLGSREYVRRAVAAGKKLVGALNNDMVGYAEDHRLDNTIRYSNKGIRDLQHGAALLFTDLVLHDAEYYKSTDAAAYYDAYGDIVGGIGSYPILASPHYHQTHDVLETINHRLVTEVAKATTASIMLMASSPSRVEGLQAQREGPSLVVSWEPAVEEDVVAYLVAWGLEGGPTEGTTTVREPTVSLRDVRQDRVVSVKALNRRGLGGWDWARVPAGR